MVLLEQPSKILVQLHSLDFNPSMVLLEPANDFAAIDGYKYFNPSMVLLEPSDHVNINEITGDFNPSMVLLEPIDLGGFCMVFVKFQSQYGLIRTGEIFPLKGDLPYLNLFFYKFKYFYL